jgi:hypothetical protein
MLFNIFLHSARYIQLTQPRLYPPRLLATATARPTSSRWTSDAAAAAVVVVAEEAVEHRTQGRISYMYIYRLKPGTY